MSSTDKQHAESLQNKVTKDAIEVPSNMMIPSEKTVENPVITSMAQAVAYLKKALAAKGEINVSDTEFIPNEPYPQADQEGIFYVVSLVSISLKKQGGTGTVGKYKVYQNGYYVLAY